MTTCLSKRLSAAKAYLSLDPAGVAYDAVKQELIDTIKLGLDVECKNAVKDLLRLGLPDVIAAILSVAPDLKPYTEDFCPMGLMRPSSEGLQSTKAALRLIAPHITGHIENRRLDALDLARHFDAPDLIEWIDENVTSLELENGLPSVLLLDSHGAWGPKCPKFSAWLEARILAADLGNARWQQFTEDAVRFEDLRLLSLLLRKDLPRVRAALGGDRVLVNSHMVALREISANNHTALKLTERLPERILSLSEDDMKAILDELAPGRRSELPPALKARVGASGSVPAF